MKIVSAKVKNFGSYRELEFHFNNQGLTLISGSTGAGKSTLCDIIPWILFGTTSKGGTVDEIRNWSAVEPTEGVIYLDNVTISRKRGKVNDLMYWPVDGVVTRGKDLNDTQKQINAFLGISADLYLSGAYFHEFSQSAQFFSTTAKNRREITEQIADLSLAKKIAENITSYKKDLKLELESLEKEMLLIEDRYVRRIKEEADYKKQYEAWQERQAAKIAQAKTNYHNFEDNKRRTIDKINASIAYESEEYNKVVQSVKHAKIVRNDLTADVERLNNEIENCDKEKCEHCGAPKQNEKRRQLVRTLQRFETELASVVADLKHYDMNLHRLEVSIKLLNDNLIKERNKENTWQKQYDELVNEVAGFAQGDPAITKELANKIEELTGDINILKTELSDLELLVDINDKFRGLLIKNTISMLQSSTNKFLTDYFDAEIRVAFEMTDSDKLDVTIYKDGNKASFTQLSKGQRQLLKLCFGISMMQAVANHNGVSFNAVFLDEVFNGMDETLKAKGFNLLQSLANEYSSVFAIDHSEELKSRFVNRYDVELVNGGSKINHG